MRRMPTLATLKQFQNWFDSWFDTRSPMPDRILKFFGFAHLREDLQAVSKPFHDLAHQLVDVVPAGPERTVALRKLLEAKDAAVRAVAIPE